MDRVAGSYYPRQLELEICDAIVAQRRLEFDYDGYHRVVQPYCHGFTRKGSSKFTAA